MRGRNLVERRFAEFHHLYTESFVRDVPVYLDLAAKASSPILEVGCGAGRLLSRLAPSGHEIQGIDTSRPLLERAVARLHPWSDRVRVHNFDLRHGALPERFGAAFVSLYYFNALIDLEEQRLFLRHLIASMSPSGVVTLDLFCPLTFVRPQDVGTWREREHEIEGRRIQVRDLREMLTPLLERRTQIFRIDGGPETEWQTHRRYVSPQQIRTVLSEAGFERVRWVQDYDLRTARPVEDDDRPTGPFLMLAQA